MLLKGKIMKSYDILLFITAESTFMIGFSRHLIRVNGYIRGNKCFAIRTINSIATLFNKFSFGLYYCSNQDFFMSVILQVISSVLQL